MPINLKLKSIDIQALRLIKNLNASAHTVSVYSFCKTNKNKVDDIVFVKHDPNLKANEEEVYFFWPV